MFQGILTSRKCACLPFRHLAASAQLRKVTDKIGVYGSVYGPDNENPQHRPFSFGFIGALGVYRMGRSLPACQYHLGRNLLASMARSYPLDRFVDSNLPLMWAENGSYWRPGFLDDNIIKESCASFFQNDFVNALFGWRIQRFYTLADSSLWPSSSRSIAA